MIKANTYTYHDNTALTPAELFFYIGVYQTCKQLGITDVLGAAAVISGQPIIPVRGKLGGATKGSSPVSMLSRKLTGIQLKNRFPTIIMSPLEPNKWKIAMTKNLGAVVGRSVPVLGWTVVSYDVVVIVANTISEFNDTVKPEDKLF